MGECIDRQVKATLTDQQVADFLANDPEFFIRHPELLNSLQLPHGEQETRSLVEYQQQIMRKRNSDLNRQLQELSLIAQTNEKIYQVFSACHRQLLSFEKIEDLSIALRELVCQQLGLVEMHLIKIADQHQSLISKRLTPHGHYLGRLTQEEQTLLFERESQSSAVYIIGSVNQPMALLAFSSANPDHFTPAQDSYFIQEFIKALEIKLA